MTVLFRKSEGITSGLVKFSIEIAMSASEVSKMTPDELRELAHSKLDQAIGSGDE